MCVDRAFGRFWAPPQPVTMPFFKGAGIEVQPATAAWADAAVKKGATLYGAVPKGKLSYQAWNWPMKSWWNCKNSSPPPVVPNAWTRAPGPGSAPGTCQL